MLIDVIVYKKALFKQTMKIVRYMKTVIIECKYQYLSTLHAHSAVSIILKRVTEPCGVDAQRRKLDR